MMASTPKDRVLWRYRHGSRRAIVRAVDLGYAIQIEAHERNGKANGATLSFQRFSEPKELQAHLAWLDGWLEGQGWTRER